MLVLFLVSVGPPIFSQNKIEHRIWSNHVNDYYDIEVVLPQNYDSLRTYPVAYCLDWLAYSGIISNTVGLLQFYGEIEPIILVGIKAEGGMTSFSAKRTRDFVPPNDEVPPGRANEFMLFLEEELIPFIHINHSADTLKTGLIGYSFGGLFGVYAINSKPHLFSRYLIGSPSVWVQNFRQIEGLNQPAFPSEVDRVFVTVGEKEVPKQQASFKRTLAFFSQDISKPNRIGSAVISGEGHSTAVISSFLKGIRFLYEK